MTRILLALAVAAFAVGCGSSSDNTSDGGATGTDGGITSDGGAGTDGGVTTDGGTGTDGGTADAGTPPAPTLGTTQIDRMGRAAVNTALTAPFESDPAVHDQKQDAYNKAADPAQWGSQFTSEIAANLPIYDALDTVCGNQFGAGPTPTPGRYDTLAQVLARDTLLVNTASGTCSQYLGVEANVTGLLQNNDCGGRTPLYDVIDTTYSLLAEGKTSGVTDGVNKDNDGGASTTAFPFLTAPNASNP